MAEAAKEGKKKEKGTAWVKEKKAPKAATLKKVRLSPLTKRAVVITALEVYPPAHRCASLRVYTRISWRQRGCHPILRPMESGYWLEAASVGGRAAVAAGRWHSQDAPLASRLRRLPFPSRSLCNPNPSTLPPHAFIFCNRLKTL